MGWKSTIDITREQAIAAIMGSVKKTPYDDMTNRELEEVMYDLNIGDDLDKPYFGRNFNIVDKLDEEEE